MPDAFFLVTGILLALLGGLIFCAAVSSNRSHSQRTTGTVVRIEVDNTRHLRGTFPHYPVVTYTVDGKEYTAKSETYTRIGTKYKLGQRLTVHYDPNSPKKIRVGVDAWSFAVGITMAILGLALVALYFI